MQIKIVLLLCPGMDLRRAMVPDLAGARRLDVHGVHSEPLRHLAGPLCGGDAARHLSEHHVDEARQAAGARRLGAVVRHLSAAVGRIQ